MLDDDENLWDDSRLHEDDPLIGKTSIMTRFIHFFADCTAVLVLYYSLVFAATYFFAQTGRVPVFLERRDVGNLLIVVIYLVYCWFMEAFASGQTLGKLITRHRVVSANGSPATLSQITIRTAVRMLPFEPLSVFFFSDGSMWHDRWSRTRIHRS